MKKVLITGGAGFIGTYVAERLHQLGIQPLILDHAPSRHKVPDFADVMLGDVRDSTAVTEAAAHVDGIIHLAAVLGTQETIQNPRPSAETNIIGGLNVFEAAAQYDLPVVYAGVGNHWMRNYATGSYTISKTAVEDYARMFNAFRDSHISVVRPVNAYGPRQSVAAPYGTSRVRKIIPSFTARALLGHDIEIYGDGEQISDCVYVGDVARVFVEALMHTATNGPLERPAEVGPATSHTVNQVAEKINSIAGALTERPNLSRLVHLPMRPGEVPGATVNADPGTMKPLGIGPDSYLSLDDGLARTVTYYFENHLEEWKRAHA